MADSVPFDTDRCKASQYTHFESHRTEYILSWWEIVRGILPSLRYIVNRGNMETNSGRSKKIRVSEFPDTHLSGAQSGIDPYGNDYFCNICSHELANTYFHCYGCESLLAKDYNICIACYNDGSSAVNVEMHRRGNTAMACHFHHVGKPKAQCSNPSKHNMKCTECNKCLNCNCTCHTVFEKRQRFYTQDRLRIMLERCTEMAIGSEIKYSFEAECQLYGEPLISISKNQVDEPKSSITSDAISAHSKALRAIPDDCQPKDIDDDDCNRKIDITSNAVDDNFNKISSATVTQCNMQRVSSRFEAGERGHDSKELTTLKHLSRSMDVVDVGDDNAAEILNLSTGEIQNVDHNNCNMGLLNQAEFVNDVEHPISSERFSKTTFRTPSSPMATILNRFSNSQSPCIVPVCSNEHAEYDAV